MIIGRRTQEVRNWNVGLQFCAFIQSLERQPVIVVRAGRKRKITIRGSEAGPELHCLQKLVLSVGKFLLLEQADAETVTQFGIVGVCADERAESRLRLLVPASRIVKIGKIPLQ